MTRRSNIPEILTDVIAKAVEVRTAYLEQISKLKATNNEIREQNSSSHRV